MNIGIPKEIKPQEQRVGLTPAAVQQLTSRGHHLIVEKGAGIGSGFPDSAYQKAGAALVTEHADVFSKAEFIIKVKEPLEEEVPYFRSGLLLYTYLHLAANIRLTEQLLAAGVNALAYETIEEHGTLPCLRQAGRPWLQVSFDESFPILHLHLEGGPG